MYKDTTMELVDVRVRHTGVWCTKIRPWNELMSALDILEFGV